MNSLFRKPLFGVHFGNGSHVKGKWVEGAPTIISLDASVQPTTPHDMQYLDIGRRERKSYTLYTDTKLVAWVPGLANPDCVDINSERYEVSAEASWQNNVIAHYKYIVTLLQAIET
jgi:hypothetical protein